MKTLQLILLILCMLNDSAAAQYISPSVIAGSGDYYITSGGSISFTTGEMTMIETFSAPNAIITQGFQQPYDSLGVYIPELTDDGITITLFPNPSNATANLAIQTRDLCRISIKVFDLLVREVLSYNIDADDFIIQVPMDVSSLKPGLYHVQIQLYSKQNQKNSSQFIKLQTIK